MSCKGLSFFFSNFRRPENAHVQSLWRGRVMPFKLLRVSYSQVGRMFGKKCHVCQKDMDVKIDSLIVIKYSGGSRYAHPDCAVQKNWIDNSEIQKEYLLADSHPK